MVKRSPPLFDPDALSLEELRNVFTDREDLLQKMEDAINRFIKDGSRRHLLLVGQRGVGKSTLLRFLEKDFEKRYSKKKALISLLFTDYKCLHDAQDLGDILMRITAELYRIKGIPIEVKHTARLEEKLEIVEKRLEKCGINDKIVLMVENLQNLMEMRPRETGFEGMRAFVENHKNILLIGTATEIPKSIWKYKSRFWAFFDILSVEPLSEKHFLEMMERMARHYDGKILLDKDGKLRKEISLKIRSIYHLVSGYPRLGVSLYEVLVLEEPQEVAKSFDSMLDNLSPYFEGIDAKLSMQERYVFGQIVRKISPNISNANFSFEEVFEKGPEKERGRNRALFSKLKKKGFLTVHHKEGRRVYHRLSNPIFGIWYLKTHVKGAAVEGRHILEFIHAFYTIEEFVERFGALTIPETVPVPVKAAFESLKEEYIFAATHLGVTLAENGKPKEALEKFEKAIEAARKKKDQAAEAMSWGNKGFALGLLGRYEEALVACDNAIEINPENAEAWSNKGMALGHLGMYQEALAAYDKALEVDSEYDAAWNNKGVALGRLGRYEEALVACDKAVEINPENAKAWSNKGNALGYLGMYQEALAAYDKALEIDPEDAIAWINKGIVLSALEMHREALEAYDKAFALASEKDQMLISSAALTNRVVALIGSDAPLHIGEELGVLLESLGRGRVPTQLKVQFLLSIFQALIRKEKVILIHDGLKTLEGFEKGMPTDETIYPSFEPVKLALEYLEAVAESPQKGEEELEKAAPLLRKEAKMLLGIAEN